MRRKRNMPQMKEKDKTPKKINEMEESNLSNIEPKH